ncbi:MAG: (2Fe-2S)-binding protein [Bacteroidia bacterium]|nr:(2Fe-2S)-binding protein [Bacteroidia bacterium]
MQKDYSTKVRDKTAEIEFTVNGAKLKRKIPCSMLLLDLIRDELSLTGTKPGCNEGECGACTVLVNGFAVNSCLYPAVNIHGKKLTTIEGMLNGTKLDPVQEALIKYGAVQCGFCTSGMVMSIKSFQNICNNNKITPSRDEIKKSIEGNLCRCTGYVSIIEAIESLFTNI